MLILDGTMGSDITPFLIRLQEETLLCSIILYEEWSAQHSSCNTHEHQHPEGIIYLRVSPEIAHARLHKQTSPQAPTTLEHIQQTYNVKEELFIKSKNTPPELKCVPVLVLNGNIDFQTDFSQFYNHLFYIRRFLKEIQDRKDIAMGIHKEKTPPRKCC
jgi:hypothetical protein